MAGNSYPVSTPGLPSKISGAHSTLFCAIALAIVLSFGVSGCSLGLVIQACRLSSAQ